MRRGKSGIVTTDGPHIEAKEVLGGFMVVEADSYDHAAEIALGSPHLGEAPWRSARSSTNEILSP